MNKSPGLRIVGRWIAKDGKVVRNRECQIIDHLIKYDLLRVDEREGGWAVLFQDPTDGVFWELTYPQGEMHGGGPPTLTEHLADEVQALYGRLPPQETR
jgi:hypothetical protein